jgi:transcriptional regulator with XRE-family HTH domain
MAATPTHRDCAVTSATLTAAIRDFGTAKEVAEAGGCSEATAARYRRGETMPNPVILARLMGRSRQIANAMLRLAGLDDLSMDLEEARLRQELRQLEARRGGSLDVETTDAAPGAVAGTMVDPPGGPKAEAVNERALGRAWDALRDADRRRP